MFDKKAFWLAVLVVAGTFSTFVVSALLLHRISGADGDPSGNTEITAIREGQGLSMRTTLSGRLIAEM
jgi:hypothetical protein